MPYASRIVALAVLVGLSAVGCASDWMERQLGRAPNHESTPAGSHRFPEKLLERETAGSKSNTPAVEAEQPVADVSAAADTTDAREAEPPNDRKLAELRAAQESAVQAYREQRGGRPIAPIEPSTEPTIASAAHTTPAETEAATTEASGNPLRDASATSGDTPRTTPSPPPAASTPPATPDVPPSSAPVRPADPVPSTSETARSNNTTIERKATVEAQFDLAELLGTEAAYRAVSAYFPPVDGDWKNRTYADKAKTGIDELRAGADSAGAADKPGIGKWKTQLGHAIESLEFELAHDESRKAGQSVREETALRLLYLIDNQRQRAARPMEHLAPAEQSFWQHQLFGLAVYLDDAGTPVDDNRNTLALRELRKATAALAAATGKLDVRSPAFCTHVRSFGCFTEFEKPEFTPDQEVVLYCEVDNFSTKELPDGKHLTSIQGSYQIYASDGRRVADHTFPLQRETCRNPRRDYFLPYRMWMPKSNVFPGSYTLQLTLEDTIGEKFGQTSIDFTIKEPRPTRPARRLF